MNMANRRVSRWIIFILVGLLLYGVIAPLLVAVRASSAAAVEASIAGTYAGAVTITEPAPLGALDLVIDLTADGDTLAGKVNAARTQVFLGGPTVAGQITAGTSVTPTIRIDSESFTGLVSGRTVQRKFTLVGEVTQDRNTLRGDYTETITGFTPQPLLVKGTFFLVRPDGSNRIIAAPDFPTPTPTQTATPTVTGTPPTATPTATPTVTGTPPTATPTATASVTPEPGGSQSSSLYLPLVGNGSAAVQSAGMVEIEEIATPVPVEPAATPEAPAEPVAAAEMALAASVDTLAEAERTEAGQPAVLLLNTDALVLTAGEGETTVRVRVRDAIGRPVPGATVTFTGEGGSLNPTSATTDANGAAAVTFSAGSAAGQATILATVNELTRQAAVQIVKPNSSALGHTLSVSSSTARLDPGQQGSFTFTLRDAAGQPVAGELVSLFGSLGEMTAASALSDANGRVTATFRAGSAEGQAMITALAGYASVSVTVQIGDTTSPDQPDNPDEPDNPDQPDDPDGDAYRIFLPVTMN